MRRARWCGSFTGWSACRPAKEDGRDRLRSGVALAGDAPGWFRAALEALLMRLDGGTVNRLRKELARARQAPPTREAVMAVIAMLGQPDTAENRKAVVGLLFGMRDWLLQAAPLRLARQEVHALAETFIRFDAFDLLQEYARAARRRDAATQAGGSTTSSPVPVAKWDGCRWERPTSSRRWPTTPSAGTTSMPPTASNASSPVSMGRPNPPPAAATLEDELDNAAMEILITEMIQRMPRDFARSVRDLVRMSGGKLPSRS